MKSKKNQAKLFILSILLIFSIIAIATINISALVYDEIDDSYLNTSLWDYASTSGTCTFQENTDYNDIVCHAPPDNKQGYFQTNNLSSINILKNVTFRAYSYAYYNNGANCARAFLDIFGTRILNQRACNAGSTLSDDSV